MDQEKIEMSEQFRLYVIDNYVAGNVYYRVGDVLDLTEQEYTFLQNDAPSCFSTSDPANKKKAVSKSPKNKAIQKPKKTKGK